jgi:hypothetical protein
MRCNFDVSAITALLASSESFVRGALLKLHSEAILDLDTETGTFFMHDLMMMYSGWLHSNMTSKDKDFSAQYRPTVCLARLRGHVLQLLKSETQKVISSGSLCDFTAKPRREMLEHIIDITRDPPVSQELLVRSHFPRLTLCTHAASRKSAGRGPLRFKADVVCTAAHVQVSVRFFRGKWLPGNEGEFVCSFTFARFHFHAGHRVR